jgi:hypothetical protein
VSVADEKVIPIGMKENQYQNHAHEKICYAGFDHKGLKCSGFHIDVLIPQKQKEGWMGYSGYYRIGARIRGGGSLAILHLILTNLQEQSYLVLLLYYHAGNILPYVNDTKFLNSKCMERKSQIMLKCC